ncbi:hypothetical protein COO60DRAFT_857255 [Scenedesmus sp. NREL 46B-D3]|nr:hypothetical protein COO60DRAFT_857255 [Scenedesmus sp. NREL 46B-D3]
MASYWRAASFLLMGNKHFTKHGYTRASKSFDNSCMERSLAGRVCIVTGANAGLGFTCSQELARRGATLYMVCRSEERGRQALEKVRADSGNSDVHLAVCDVSSLASVASFAANWLASSRPCHLLVNNAGVLLNERLTTPEGQEQSFATNALGTAALTQRLMPALLAGAPSRVIFVSSGGMYTERLHLDDLQHSSLQPWDGSAAYARDKRRQVAMAEHLTAAMPGQGVSFFSMHPGWSDTEGVASSIPGFHKAFRDKLRDTQQGVDTTLWLALEDEVKLQPGAFYLDRSPQIKHLTLGGTQYSPQQAADLWRKLMQMAGLPEQAGPAAAADGAAQQ